MAALPQDAGRRGNQFVDLFAGSDVLGEGHPAETVRAWISDACVVGEFVAAPEDDRQAAGLDEDRLLDLLAPPAELLLERPGARQVADAEGDQADPLLHAPNLVRDQSPGVVLGRLPGHRRRG
ncbi:hypothetical protein ACWEOS_00555 [Micromonospora taraxaci]